MNEVVLDASVILRWAFDDEGDRDGALEVARALADGSLAAWSAPHFLLEVAAALVVGIRTGRIRQDIADAVLEQVRRVAIDEADPHDVAWASYGIAIAHGIRVPDAAYVETARRRRVPLVSADATQLRAARAAGVAATALGEVSARDS